MLLPQELKKHEFSRSLRGYTTSEVDEYIAFVISKYEALYRENNETGRKFSAAVKSLEALRAREAKIAALESAIRKAAEQILSEAELKRRQIVADAEEYANRIVAEADAHVASQENQFLRIQKEAAAFRDSLFAAYSTHIDQLEELAAIAAEEVFTDPLPAVTLAEAAEEITPVLPAEAERAEAFPEAAAPDTWQDEDVYSDEELLEEAETPEDTEETAEITEDNSDKYEILPSPEEEDVYTEEELTESAPVPKAEELRPAAEAEPGPDLFAALFAEDTNNSNAPEPEEIPWPKNLEEAEEIEEIPADEKDKAPETEDDVLLRELHAVFAREFAALKTTSDAPPAKSSDNDDENLSELKKRMGIAENPKNEKTDDFSFLAEDAAEEAPQKRGLFGKNK